MAERPNYVLDQNPTYSEEIPALLDSDAVSASSIINPLITKILNNQKANHQLAQATFPYCDCGDVETDVNSLLASGLYKVNNWKALHTFYSYNGKYEYILVSSEGVNSATVQAAFLCTPATSSNEYVSIRTTTDGSTWTTTVSNADLSQLSNTLVKCDLSNITNAVFKSKAESAGIQLKSENPVAGQKAGVTLGEKATSEGTDTISSGSSTHAEGYKTFALGENSHSEGRYTATFDSIVEVNPLEIKSTSPVAFTVVSSQQNNIAFASERKILHYNTTDANREFDITKVVTSTADPANSNNIMVVLKDAFTTIPNDLTKCVICALDETAAIYSHAEGCQNFSRGKYSHSEGFRTIAKGAASHSEGQGTTASGGCSHAEGIYGTASGVNSHAEGYSTSATNDCCHSEGVGTQATGLHSHAEGHDCKASGEASHAQGFNTTASGRDSHAEGYSTTASGEYSHAEGLFAIAHDYASHAEGTFSKISTGTQGSYSANNDALIIGNGTNDSVHSNCFRVDFSGNTYGLSSYHTSGADYSEFFEWQDKNPDAKDRVGRLVTLDGEKIRYAKPDDDVLGITSALPAIIGDSPADSWKERYVTDVFGRRQTEEVTVPAQAEEKDESGVVTKPAVPEHTETRFKVNPNYDPTQEDKYENREKRPEWSTVGMIGKLVLIDDGTCTVNGYAQPAATGDGTATVSTVKTNCRVMARLDGTHIRVLLK